MALIVEVDAPATHALRRVVLRNGHASADVDYPEDSLEGSFHLGAYVGEALVGVASFSLTPCPYRGDGRAWQLRGMAIDAEHQGAGVGRALINAAVDRVRASGAAVLWCNARDTAAGFYAKLGFVTEGDGFRTKSTGLPHHVMVRDL